MEIESFIISGNYIDNATKLIKNKCVGLIF